MNSPSAPAATDLYSRIVIVGLAGSGKSTLARALSTRLHTTHIELDAFLWEPNWVAASDSVFLSRADTALPASGHWISDGNFAKARSVTWMRAQTLIWLDYPLSVVMTRLLWRTVSRLVWGTELWNGNRDRLSNYLNLDVEENLFLWNFFRFHEIRGRLRDALKEPRYAHLRVLRMGSAEETEEWLASVPERAV